MSINTYKDLIVWQKAIDLVSEIYSITESFPQAELYGLTSQMRRSAVSIPSNIAEGRRRGSKKDFRKFLLIAYGSGAELETQLVIAANLGFLKEDQKRTVEDLLEEVMKMLNKMTSSLRS